jgi:hypothetical protein
VETIGEVTEMTKIDRVKKFLDEFGWIDGSIIKKLTNTNCSRDYIYDLKRRKKLKTLPVHVTPRYTKWLRTSPNGKATASR